MRSIVGVAGLVVALAIVGVLVKRQLAAGPAVAAQGGASAASPRQAQERVRAEMSRALEAAASATRERADP